MADREAAYIGSANADYRSFRLNFECGVAVYGASMIEELLEDMDDIVAHSRAITFEQWSKRPWRRKVLEPLLRLTAIWM